MSNCSIGIQIKKLCYLKQFVKYGKGFLQNQRISSGALYKTQSILYHGKYSDSRLPIPIKNNRLQLHLYFTFNRIFLYPEIFRRRFLLCCFGNWHFLTSPPAPLQRGEGSFVKRDLLISPSPYWRGGQRGWGHISRDKRDYCGSTNQAFRDLSDYLDYLNTFYFHRPLIKLYTFECS